MNLCPSVQLQILMKPALIKNKPRHPHSWDILPVGDQLKESVERILSTSSRRFFGYHLVKIGNLSHQVQMQECSIKQTATLVSDFNELNHDKTLNEHGIIVGDAHELPFLESSVDAFLLAHELDYSKDPHQILREVDRTLVPNGHVVIVGFNPFSLAGIFRYLPFKSNKVIRNARFFSSMRINDWLNLLGFETIEQHQLLFSSLLLKKPYSAMTKLEAICRKYLPIFSSVYVIVAKKRVVPLSLIKPKWKPKPKFSPVGASMKVKS